MSFTPSSIAELSEWLQKHFEKRRPAGLIDRAGLNRILEYAPEDMTVRVEAGIRLAQLQEALAQHKQWLPLDPPGSRDISIGEMLDADSSGPRRCGFGTARDWLIGVKAVLPDGRLIESGGRVVKNVAGYDLHKLLLGARGELAVLVEATFKVCPRPAQEIFLKLRCGSLREAGERLAAIHQTAATPHVLDLHASARDDVTPGVPPAGSGTVPVRGTFPARCELITGFCGSPREVDWQIEQVRGIGPWEPATLEYHEAFFSNARGLHIHRRSVPPANLLSELEHHPSFLARAGNGTIFTAHKDPLPPRQRSPLEERVRSAFDPHGILAAAPASAFRETHP